MTGTVGEDGFIGRHFPAAGAAGVGRSGGASAGAAFSGSYAARGIIYLQAAYMMSGPRKTISFSQAVGAMHWLLATVGERSWVGHFAKHRDGRTAGFGTIFGGMGTFNDLVICRANKHRVETHQEPLADQLLRSLSLICQATSHQGDLSTAEALAACGTVGHELQGWRCRDCGYGRVSPADLNALAAYYDVAQAIEGGITSGAFLESIQSVWARLDADDNISRFRPATERGGIRFSDDPGWMRPCPDCGSNDTCVYRWDFDGQSFCPSSDNLAMHSGWQDASCKPPRKACEAKGDNVAG